MATPIPFSGGWRDARARLQILVALRLIPRPAFTARLVSDHPDPDDGRRAIYVVGGRGYSKWAYFRCPADREKSCSSPSCRSGVRAGPSPSTGSVAHDSPVRATTRRNICSLLDQEGCDRLVRGQWAQALTRHLSRQICAAAIGEIPAMANLQDQPDLCRSPFSRVKPRAHHSRRGPPRIERNGAPGTI